MSCEAEHDDALCELIGKDNTVDWKCEKCQEERNKIYEGMNRMTCNGKCAGDGTADSMSK